MPIASKGRMIRREISRSLGFASLSRDAQMLFVMLIPWYNAHGKMNGQPSYIQGEVVPLLRDFTIKKVEKCLIEISKKTNVKWFCHSGMYYIHSVNFLKDHQDLRADRLGIDTMPSYPVAAWRTPGELQDNSGVRHPEVEVEVEVEVKEEEEVEGAAARPATKQFRKPTAQELSDYAQSITYSLDAEKFLAYYDSNGWRVGKNPMKDWRAAVRTWKIKSEEGYHGVNRSEAGTYAGGAKGKAFGGRSGPAGAGSAIGETKPKPGQFAEFGQ